MILPNVTDTTSPKGHIPEKKSLSPEILVELRAARAARLAVANKSSKVFEAANKRFKAAVGAAALELGVKLIRGDGDRWNQAIDAIEAAHPDWRGEVVTVDPRAKDRVAA